LFGVSCNDGQLSASLKLSCTSCNSNVGKKKVPPTGARVFVWQFQEKLWTELDKVTLALGEDTPYSVDLAAQGFSCDDALTAVVGFPVGPGHYERPETEALVNDIAIGAGLAYDFDTEQTEYFLYCDPQNIVRAEAVIYNFINQKVSSTVTLDAPADGSAGQEAVTWKGAGANKSSENEIVVFLGYDAQDAVQCSHFL
jgi:hypothetical protein